MSCRAIWFTTATREAWLFISGSRLSNLRRAIQNGGDFHVLGGTRAPRQQSHSPVLDDLQVLQLLWDLHVVEPLLLLINPELTGISLAEHLVQGQGVL